VFRIKKVLAQVRKAIEDYDMIQDKDRIAVGVSGGKDSLALLVALAELKSFYHKSFELEAITITFGLAETDLTPVADICRKLGVNYTIEETAIGKIVFQARNEKNPCSLCANMRRGALNNAAKRLCCSKVALGHNRDDLIETFLLGLFYEGRINAFSAVTYLSRMDMHVIRPLIYAEERNIKGFIKSRNLEPVPSVCPVDGKTNRQYVKELIKEMVRHNKYVKSNIYGAIMRLGL
jgi:tRNA 2-thiocytidine biosynthesis protein TtcA